MANHAILGGVMSISGRWDAVLQGVYREQK